MILNLHPIVQKPGNRNLRAIALPGLVNGVGEDFKHRVLAPVNAVRAENHRGPQPHPVSPLQALYAVVAIGWFFRHASKPPVPQEKPAAKPEALQQVVFLPLFSGCSVRAGGASPRTPQALFQKGLTLKKSGISKARLSFCHTPSRQPKSRQHVGGAGEIIPPAQVRGLALPPRRLPHQGQAGPQALPPAPPRQARQSRRAAGFRT